MTSKPSVSTGSRTLLAINYHLWKPCNLRCCFCFATFRDVRGALSLTQALQLLEALKEAGCQKLNFVGGEPTLHPHIGALLCHAKELGFTTSMVSNGARLAGLLDRQADDLDWLGLSIDSGIEEVQAALGRGRGDHIHKSINLADQARSVGIRLKLNSVVTALNWQEDLSELVRRILPERWKVFQVLPIDGQNDGAVEELLITPQQFHAFLDRHQHLAAEGLPPIAEDNDAMKGSYAMIDPLGRFFGNATGRQIYSEPILEIGVQRALSQIDFDPEKLIERGGVYRW